MSKCDIDLTNLHPELKQLWKSTASDKVYNVMSSVNYHDNSKIPLLIGFSAYWLLFGVFLSQLWCYFVLFGLNDVLIVRALIFGVFTASIMFSVTVVEITWKFFNPVLGPTGFFVAPFSVYSSTAPVMISFVSLAMHFFFAWRIRLLKRYSKPFIFICGIICLASLAQFGAAVAVVVKFNSVGRKPADKMVLSCFTAAWLVGGLFCDVLITTTMTCVLLQARAKSNFNTTMKALNRLISLSIETAFPTVTVAIAQIVAAMRYSGTNFDLLFMFLLFIVYVNGLFSVLNRRVALRQIVAGTIASADIRAVVGARPDVSEAEFYFPQAEDNGEVI